MIKMTLAAAALAVSAPAFATAETDLGTAVVYGDLNLASSRGVAQLERRIQRAANRTCGEIPVMNLGARERAEDCHSLFISEAHAKLQPVLAARAKDRATTLAAR